MIKVSKFDAANYLKSPQAMADYLSEALATDDARGAAPLTTNGGKDPFTNSKRSSFSTPLALPTTTRCKQSWTNSMP
jgi:hypothetical protein